MLFQLVRTKHVIVVAGIRILDLAQITTEIFYPDVSCNHSSIQKALFWLIIYSTLILCNDLIIDFDDVLTLLGRSNTPAGYNNL